MCRLNALELPSSSSSFRQYLLTCWNCRIVEGEKNKKKVEDFFFSLHCAFLFGGHQDKCFYPPPRQPKWTFFFFRLSSKIFFFVVVVILLEFSGERPLWSRFLLYWRWNIKNDFQIETWQWNWKVFLTLRYSYRFSFIRLNFFLCWEKNISDE